MYFWKLFDIGLLGFICHIETRCWEQLSAELPRDARVYTISMDLPFALARWQVAEGVTHQALSAHRSEHFGEADGVLIKEWRLLQRAVFVIDRHDRVVYAEYVVDQMREPDHNAAMQAIRQALASEVARTSSVMKGAYHVKNGRSSRR